MHACACVCLFVCVCVCERVCLCYHIDCPCISVIYKITIVSLYVSLLRLTNGVLSDYR